MNRRLLPLAAALSAALALAAPGAAGAKPGVRFRDVESGWAEARKSGKPLLLFFTADWCAPCRTLKREVFASGTFAKLVEKEFVPVEIVDRTREEGKNAPEVQAVLSRMRVRGFPTLVVVRADGAAGVRAAGFASRDATVEFLRTAIPRLEAAEEARRRATKPAAP